MNYEEWSKSIELGRTLTPIVRKRGQAPQTEPVPFFEVAEFQQNGPEQRVRGLTHLGSPGSDDGFEVDRTASNSNKLEHSEKTGR